MSGGKSDLLPCPFCGGEASRSIGRNGDNSPWQYIECEKCTAMSEFDMWNKRFVSDLRIRQAESLDFIADNAKLSESQQRSLRWGAMLLRNEFKTEFKS